MDLLKFLTCGSVDDGKSTLIGHILYDSKLLYADQKEALILDSKVGSRGGEIDYSLLLDGLSAEREQGITIDVAYRYFTTDNRSFIVADTPGHEEYTRNMAVGASFADLAVILIDASKGVVIQTKRHARICALMGIKYFVFAVNKMDLVDYSEDRFNEITQQIKDLSKELSLYNIEIIPVSATAGDNVTTKSENMPWYHGDNILHYLENVDIDSDKEEGFYFPVQRVCRPNYNFRGFQGEIESGTVKQGDEISVLPSGESAVIKEVYVGDKKSESAEKGQPVTLTLDREIDVSRGSVIFKDTDIKTAKKFNATLLWMDDAPLSSGSEYFIKLGTKKIAGRINKILYKTDINTGEKLDATSLEKNEIALCELALDEEIPIDLFKRHKTLGELILIDRISNMTAACGVVEEIAENDDSDYTIFENDELKVRTLLFDEFFYNDKSAGVDNYSNEHKIFRIGDEVPLSGESYQYPEYFDVFCRDDKAAILIRNAQVFDIVPLDKYSYGGFPLVNDKGFAIDVHSKKEYDEFLSDEKSLERQQFYEKWMRFETYRKIIFTSNYWGL